MVQDTTQTEHSYLNGRGHYTEDTTDRTYSHLNGRTLHRQSIAIWMEDDTTHPELRDSGKTSSLATVTKVRWSPKFMYLWLLIFCNRQFSNCCWRHCDSHTLTYSRLWRENLWTVCMDIHWPTPGFEGRTFELCVWPYTDPFQALKGEILNCMYDHTLTQSRP